MAIHKLNIGEFDEVDYDLIAIHTSLEDYRLAYFINQKLPVLLIKNEVEIPVNIKEGEVRFSRFTFEDPEKESYWNLIWNRQEVVILRKESRLNLFSGTETETSKKVYLLPELKKVDYFLKVENSEETLESITTIINTIKQISAVYKIDTTEIKSKNNLIF